MILSPGQKLFPRWIGLFLLSAIFVTLLEMLRLPAALFLGPMLAAILFAATGATVTVPAIAITVSQAVVGLLVARSVPISIVSEVAEDWPIFFGGVISVLAAAGALGYILAKMQVLPGTSAIWGSLPGGASVMSIMAEAFGADVRLVAFMQYLRVVCVASAAAIVSRLYVGDLHGAVPAIDWFPPIAIVPALETLAIIVVSLPLAKRLAMPAGALLLPMIIGLVGQGSNLIAIELPPWLLAMSYAVIGWMIGIRFNRAILAHVARAFPRVLASILLLLVICCGFAALLVIFAGIDPLTAYLATSPGGVDSIAIIAASTTVDVPFIMAMQLVRLFMILLTGPFIARSLVRWSGLSDAPKGSPAE